MDLDRSRWQSRRLLLQILDRRSGDLWRTILLDDGLSVRLQLLLYIVKIGLVPQWLTLLTSVGCVQRHDMLLASLLHWRRFKLRFWVLKESFVGGLGSFCDLLRWRLFLLKICWGNLRFRPGLLSLCLATDAKECSTSIICCGGASLNYLVSTALFVHLGQYLDKLRLVEPAFLK